MSTEQTTTKVRATRKQLFTVASKVKDFVKEKEFYASNDLPDALSDRVTVILSEAIERANANGRRTVRPCDL